MKQELPSGPSDQRIDTLVSRILRIGVLVSGVVVLIGTALSLWEHRGGVADYHLFRGEPTDLRGPSGIWRAARALQAAGIVQLGLLVLVGTPIARVAFVAIAFARQRDRLYTVVAVAVLVTLLFSVFGARP